MSQGSRDRRCYAKRKEDGTERAAARATVEVEFEAAAAALYPGLVRRLTVLVRDPEEAKDLAQAAYLRAFEKWDTFDGRDIRAWLYTIGIRLALNELRRRRRWLAFAARRQPHEFTPTAEVDLWRVLGELAPSHRAALLLHVLDGYSHREIGSMLGVPAGTVGSWISRAKERLRERLGETPA